LKPAGVNQAAGVVLGDLLQQRSDRGHQERRGKSDQQHCEELLDRKSDRGGTFGGQYHIGHVHEAQPEPDGSSCYDPPSQRCFGDRDDEGDPRQGRR